jgi:hypothetical protein
LLPIAKLSSPILFFLAIVEAGVEVEHVCGRWKGVGLKGGKLCDFLRLTAKGLLSPPPPSPCAATGPPFIFGLDLLYLNFTPFVETANRNFISPGIRGFEEFQFQSARE